MAIDKEEEWFRKFYKGTLFVKGWKHHMKEILQKTPPDDKEQIRKLLENLGKKIGSEWAKDNKIRKVNSAMLQRWGNDLDRATKKGSDTLIAKISQVDNEVDNILS